MTQPARSPVRVAVRPMRAGDEPFVFRGWLKACRRCERHRHLPAPVYYSDVHAQLERLIAAPVVMVALAVAEEDPTAFFGFICTERLAGEPRILHFAYVKREARRRGVFRRMAGAVGLNLERPFFYTHHTFVVSELVRAFPAAVYRRDVLGLPR